jgi:hypothetical protein
MLPRVLTAVALLGAVAFLNATPPDTKTKTPREALQAFSDLIGDWKCTGTPNGTQAEKSKGFWVEKMSWEWQFKDKDAWLKIVYDKGKYYTGGELRYVPDKDHYTLTLTTIDKEKQTFVGTIETRDTTKIVTFEREVGKESQRFVFRLLHDDVYRYSYDVKAEGRPFFKTKWSVGATPHGRSFAAGTGKPECIVSGGTGTSPVMYMGKTYYVCCSGCRDEFNASPAKYVKEWEEKQAKLKKK